MFNRFSFLFKITVTLILIIGLIITGCSGSTKYELTLEVNTEDAGAVTGSGEYEGGETVSVSATPQQGYEFVRWEQGDEEVSVDENYNLELDQDTHLVAIFREEIEDENGEEDSEDEEKDAEDEDETEENDTDDTKDVDDTDEKDNGQEDSDEYSEEDEAWEQWDRDTVSELAYDSLAVYFTYLSPQEFEAQALEDFEAGNLSVNYPGVEDFRSPEKPYRDDIDIEIIEMEAHEDEVLVTAEIAYPHVSSDKFEELAEQIQQGILSTAEDQAVNLEEQFRNVVDDADLDQQITEKNLTIAKHIEDDQEQLRVIEIDQPEELLESFDQLFIEAVVNQMDELTFELQENEVFDVREDNLRGDFAGQQIEVTLWPDNVINYFIDDLDIVMDEELQLAADGFWEDLQTLAGYDPYLRFSPQDYFHQVELRETNEDDYKSLLLTRPYAAATMDSVIGYVDVDSEEVNLFTKIPGSGMDIRDFSWSPNGDYLAYAYKISGVGSGNLELYSYDQDQVISVADLDIIDEQYLGEEPGIRGEIQNIEWSDDMFLTFGLHPFEEETIIDYELDLETLD